MRAQSPTLVHKLALTAMIAALANSLSDPGMVPYRRPAPKLIPRSMEQQRAKMEAANAKRLRRRIRNLANTPLD